MDDVAEFDSETEAYFDYYTDGVDEEPDMDELLRNEEEREREYMYDEEDELDEALRELRR